MTNQHWEELNILTALLTFVCLVCVHCTHIFFFSLHKKQYWDANTETMHQQLLQLVSSIQELWIIEEKWRFVKSIRRLKWTNEKVGWRCASYKKSIQIVSQQGNKCPDTIVNLVWANTYISRYVMRDSVGIAIRSMQALHTGLCVFAPQLASMHWHAIGTKWSVFSAGEHWSKVPLSLWNWRNGDRLLNVKSCDCGKSPSYYSQANVDE